jgi:hypothetical protein
MKYLKIVFVVVLVVFSGSCSLFVPPPTYYYVVSSGCTYNGFVHFTMPSGVYQNYNNPLIYYVTKAYKFESGAFIYITASFWGDGIVACYGKNITVTIMKGTSAEGGIGSGGTVWKTATSAGAVSVYGYAD